MSMSVSMWPRDSMKTIWLKTEAQKQRQEDHKASVIEQDGNFKLLSEKIITPKGLEKTNKLISVVPKENESVYNIDDVGYLFSELKQMNIILTNACNLSCSYCYEQHNKDFGRFTNESLLTAYRFLNNANKHQRKVFQFFGGEPLIHKDIIIDFLRKNEVELRKNSRGDYNTVVGIVTNGLLLSQELVEEYFKYDFTFMLISLDTDKSSVDHREIGQDKIDKLLEQISNIPNIPKQQKRVTIRCTLARENAPYFKEFVDNLYGRGIRRLVVHPLILDSSKGFIKWNEQEWNTLHKDILHSINKYQDLQIHFSEGVGQKKEENCMIGSDMIAIDGSGDFSGCYFFTNQKGNTTSDTILGNIFQGKIYLDRYRKFQKEYAKMFEEEEQCKTCNYKNACYQCPAGNLDTGSKMFRPDDMCQKIVKLYVDLQDDIGKKQTKSKFDILVNSVFVEGYETTHIKALSYMLFYSIFSYHPADLNLVHKDVEKICGTSNKLLGLWSEILDNKHTDIYQISPEDYLNVLGKKVSETVTLEIDEFYYKLLEHRGIINSNKVKANDIYQRTFFLTLMHLVILNKEKISFNDSLKTALVDD
jgi:uncharacterized protein